MPLRRFRVVAPVALCAVGAALLLLLGVSAEPPTSAIFQQGLIVGALAISFQLIYGLLGELSLGHSALFGAGAYAYAHLAQDLPPLVALLLAPLVGMVIGATVALLTLRVEGVYFAVVTFALAMIAGIVVSASESLGRNEGLAGVPSLPLPEGLLRPQLQILVTGLVFAGFLALLYSLRRTTFGATMEVVRTDRNLALSQSINVGRLRVVVTAMSGLLAALAGAVFAQNARFVSPDVFALYYIITPLAVVAVGGLRHTLGVIPGVLVVVVAPRFLGLDPIANAALAAVLLVVAVLVFPRGIAGGVEDAVRRLARRRRPVQDPTSPLVEEVASR